MQSIEVFKSKANVCETYKLRYINTIKFQLEKVRKTKMNEHIQTQLFVIMCVFYMTSATIETITMREDVNFREVVIVNNNVGVYQTKNLIRCTDKCISSMNCVSLFYNPLTYHCVLNGFRISSANLSTTTSTGEKYYERTDGDFGKSPGNENQKNKNSHKQSCDGSPGFIYNETMDVCYKFGSEVTADFDVIKQACTGLESDLIRIDSQEKQDFVEAILINDTSMVVCIQGNSETGSFRFDDGTLMTYTNWNTGQPDGGGQHYIGMFRTHGYLWRDIYKSSSPMKCNYICEN